MLFPIFSIVLFRVGGWNGVQQSSGSPTAASQLLVAKLADSDQAEHSHSVDLPLSSGPLENSMRSMGFSEIVVTALEEKLTELGISDSYELVLMARDFVDRPEVFASSVLQRDLGFSQLLSHQTRAAVMELISSLNNKSTKGSVCSPVTASVELGPEAPSSDPDREPSNVTQTRLFKSVIVNEKAQRRRKPTGSQNTSYEYGLPANYPEMYPILARELDDFYAFMTRPTTLSQETPIRPATAEVYMRHAKLFLGWYMVWAELVNGETAAASIFTIVPNREKESADCFLEFILWLRNERNISVSYEANVLRGLNKLLKYRFAKESKTDPDYGGKSFDDVPLIREVRKLHRDANRRQTRSPRSSDEERKWVSWSEYLGTIESIKGDLDELIHRHMEDSRGLLKTKQASERHKASQRKIATYFQKYLILAIFACVPDRQRTIRELELNQSFVKDKKIGVWVIKHGPDDYKTGNVYGDRPPLVLTLDLTSAIDDFLQKWRRCLNPTTNHVFVQPRTGNPLTQNSVYQIVARSCYQYTGKKTNPHLLRDMIVTHVRESNASEKQLEALALYMGHSIHMQRNSYDRRTLTQKVAPAVDLLQSLNRQKE